MKVGAGAEQEDRRHDLEVVGRIDKECRICVILEGVKARPVSTSWGGVYDIIFYYVHILFPKYSKIKEYM
jgi:hypothetical protein